MSVYDQLGAKYDQMIRWKTRLEYETPFFQRLFAEKRFNRILDLGCGTGQHCRLFRKWGVEVVGVDSSAELLAIAREGLNDSDNEIRFIEADFLDFVEKIEGKFDAAICLGNSIPHLATKKEVQKMFMNIHSVLNEDGIFVFQNRNYDRLLKTQERFLFPTSNKLADNEQIFFRFNDFDGKKVRFNVVHFTRVGKRWMHEVYSTTLHAWEQKELDEILERAGFTARHYYGDFSGTPFDAPSSSDLVGLVRRGN